MTEADTKKLAVFIAEALKRHVFPRLDKLEAAAAEEKGLTYEGAFEPGRAYRKGQFVTCAGSVWHANCATTQRPGDGPAWTLAVKRGADAR